MKIFFRGWKTPSRVRKTITRGRSEAAEVWKAVAAY